jgi:PIN domain nuclease of toxin-antitoxin system
MKQPSCLFDTHALVFWATKSSVSGEFIRYFDEQHRNGRLYASTIAFWEIALLAQKGRLSLPDIHGWKTELVNNANLQLLEPSVAEMIDSTLLPPHHKDPFDRLLIAQANHHKLTLVTQDQILPLYGVAVLWL